MFKYLVFTLPLLLILIADTVFADGCSPGEPCYETPAPAVVEAPVAVVPAAIAPPVEEKACGWGNRIAAGVPVWFFQEESTEVGGGIYLDVYNCVHPINLRIGAEVNHMGVDQPNAMNSAEFPGKATRMTFVRIPFAVEYIVAVGENTSFFIGGGPDLIRTANDVSDTTVGMHLSGRLVHEFDGHFGVGVEAGYMWGEVSDDGGGDIDLDNTFIIPTLSYRF
ncbi:hypothetical protein OAO01_05385 [Oligoflexia bacterium]|nr:hypothetical protein [Oligoflexia bacterium]